MIGKVISSLLKANASLLALVDTDNIYPYICNENSQLPLVVYGIDSVTPEYTKDGWTGDQVTFSVISLSNDYANLQLIVAQVREALELVSGTTEGITYWNILLTGQVEGFVLDAEYYMNKLTFETEVTSYS